MESIYSGASDEWAKRTRKRTAESVELTIRNRPTKITRIDVEQAAEPLAQLAELIGQTNNKKRFMRDMVNTLFDAFQEVEKRTKRPLL